MPRELKNISDCRDEVAAAMHRLEDLAAMEERERILDAIRYKRDQVENLYLEADRRYRGIKADKSLWDSSREFHLEGRKDAAFEAREILDDLLRELS